MRKIKFRAWDKVKQVMDYHPKSVTGFLNIYLSNESDLYEWLQFTGLKDKNGKKVFEGDLLGFKGNKRNKKFQHVMVVEYLEEDDFCGWSFMVHEFCGYGCSWCWLEEWKHYEVIGNIYENKDLL
ncbi:MAG: hypothetical protein KAS32_15080 [Candidatus Peribacteraceae bacterium]|nr:hypothetical protein [Candidatus Peribacteraceae bacterium]